MKRIALCDDEPHMLEQLNGYVEEYSVSRSIKLKTDSFSSAEQLLLSGLAFDLVILDIHMDGMDGMEAARRLRGCGAICP
jgi:CheY-like chemotaxis protein